MEGINIENKRPATNPLMINLPDGRQVKSTHVCDINISGLPTTPKGHIVPNLAIALLFRIQVLCKAGCKVVFENEKCEVYFNKMVVLRGYKDKSTDLWTLPINPGKGQADIRLLMPSPKQRSVSNCALDQSHHGTP